MKLFGVKQQCQDIICPGTDCNWEPECMKKCYADATDAIYSCCEDECGLIGIGSSGYDDCMSSCNTKKVEKKADAPVLLIIGLFFVFFLLVLFLLFY